MHRLGLDANVQKAAQEIGINVAETAQEADGTKYIGNINWNQGLSINAKFIDSAFIINKKYILNLEIQTKYESGIGYRLHLYSTLL